MIKPVFYITILLFVPLNQLQAQQNLILNGDFEEYWQCPDDEAQIERCKHVYNPCYHDPPAWSSTSDYFNLCSSSPVVSVPVNAPGFQNPRSRFGYVGLIVSKSSDNINYYNEYIQLEFSEVLKIGATYKFQIYVNLGDIAEYTTKNIQFKLVSDYTVYSTYLDQFFEPDFRNDSLISDTLNWIPIEFEFVAKGDEKYIIIGNFDSPIITNFAFLYDLPNSNTPNYSYFYFDDASLIFLKVADSISFPNIITPNNDGINDLLEFTLTTEAQLEIMNRWGNLIYKTEGSFLFWDGADCPDGVYFFRITINGNAKSGYIQLFR